MGMIDVTFGEIITEREMRKLLDGEDYYSVPLEKVDNIIRTLASFFHGGSSCEALSELSSTGKADLDDVCDELRRLRGWISEEDPAQGDLILFLDLLAIYYIEA